MAVAKVWYAAVALLLQPSNQLTPFARFPYDWKDKFLDPSC